MTPAPSVWRSDRRSSPRLITAIVPPSLPPTTAALPPTVVAGCVLQQHSGEKFEQWDALLVLVLVLVGVLVLVLVLVLVGCPAGERSQVGSSANRPVCSGPLTARSAITIIMTPPPSTIINDTLR